MKVLFAALVGLVLVLHPQLLAAVLTVVGGVAVQPLVIALVLGAVARPAIVRRLRGWVR